MRAGKDLEVSRGGVFFKKIQNFIKLIYQALINHYEDPNLTKFSAPEAKILKKDKKGMLPQIYYIVTWC